MTAYREKEKTPAVTFVVGFAGSGKSALLEHLVYDVVFEENFYVSSEDFKRNHTDLVRFLEQDKHCVVVERHFMTSAAREEYERELKSLIPKLQVNWLFFEKDVKAANENCRSRPPKERDLRGDQHVDQNWLDAVRYELPEHGVTIKIRDWPFLSPYHAGDCVQSIPSEPGSPRH